MDLYLTPIPAVLSLVLAIGCGYRYRENWKSKPDNWVQRAWIYGSVACLSLLALGFIPLKY